MSKYFGWVTKARVTYALAGIGAAYIVLFVGYLVYAQMKPASPTGPSELEAHPERQREILAERRAAEFKDRLGLTDEQVQKIGDIFAAQPPPDPGANPGGPEDFRERREAFQEQLAQVLTPEQMELMRQARGPFPGGPGMGPPPGGGRMGPPPGGGRMGPPPGGGRGGPRRMMTPERADELRQYMTPEQQTRFDRRLEEMRQRMQQRRGGRGGGGGGDRGGGGGRGPR